MLIIIIIIIIIMLSIIIKWCRQYDNSERDQVTHSFVQPLNPFEYGGGPAIVQQQRIVSNEKKNIGHQRMKKVEEPIRNKRGRPPDSLRIIPDDQKMERTASQSRSDVQQQRRITTPQGAPSDGSSEDGKNLKRVKRVKKSRKFDKKLKNVAKSKKVNLSALEKDAVDLKSFIGTADVKTADRNFGVKSKSSDAISKSSINDIIQNLENPSGEVLLLHLLK